MKIKNNVKNVIIISFFFLIVSFFLLPELISILKLKNRLKNIEALIDNYEKQKTELKQKLLENKNISKILEKEKEKEVSKLKEI